MMAAVERVPDPEAEEIAALELPERLPVLAVQPARLFIALPAHEETQWVNAPHADAGNALRFVLDHGRHARYAHGRGWFVWTGQRWAIDGDGAVTRLAESTATRIAYTAESAAKRAAKVMAEKGENSSEYEIAKAEAAAWKRNADHVQQLRGLRAMVELAQDDELVVTPVDALDADAYALNVANGTLDLAAGELRPHDAADLMTKLAPGMYDPEASDPRFERFLRDLTGGDDELARYLARAVGYTATGDTSEEVFFICHGPAASGKSTFLEMVKAALGDYAQTAAASTFVNRRQSGATPELARLPGARLVACSELGPGAEFTAEVVKSLTGGDRVTARALYRAEFEYSPVFALWFASNELPTVDHEDSGMWRRIHALPFVHSVPAERRDSDLKRHLIHDAGAQAAVLRWIVDGATAWRQQGLNPPAAVLAYTDAYRKASDPVAEWLRDHCDLEDPEARTARADARHSYEAWCADEGERAVSSRAFCRSLRDRGVSEAKADGVRWWVGLRLRAHRAPRAPLRKTSPHAHAGARTRAGEQVSAPSALGALRALDAGGASS
jgi:putative DNA primase/helicase